MFRPFVQFASFRLRMHSFAGRMALLMMAIVIFNVVMADDATNLQITLDSSRPLTLYRAPSTFRRDARGQLRPSIIIRAERPNPHNIQTPAVQQLTPSIAGETHRDARAQQVRVNLTTNFAKFSVQFDGSMKIISTFYC